MTISVMSEMRRRMNGFVVRAIAVLCRWWGASVWVVEKVGLGRLHVGIYIHARIDRVWPFEGSLRCLPCIRPND